MQKITINITTDYYCTSKNEYPALTCLASYKANPCSYDYYFTSEKRVEGNEGQHFIWKKSLGPSGNSSFLIHQNAPWSLLAGREPPLPAQADSLPPSAPSHSLFPAQTEMALCLRSPRSAGAALGLPAMWSIFQYVLPVFCSYGEIHKPKQFKLKHLLLRNASKIITCPTSTLCSEMIS